MAFSKYGIPKSLDEWQRESSNYYKGLDESLESYENEGIVTKIRTEARTINHLIDTDLKKLLKLKDELSLRKKYNEYIDSNTYVTLQMNASLVHKNMQLLEGLLQSVKDKSILKQIPDDWDILNNGYLLETSKPTGENGRYWMFEKVAEDFYLYSVSKDLKEHIKGIIGDKS